MTMTVRWVAALTIVIVLIQAALIGQALSIGDASRFTLHGYLGNVSFLGAVALTGLLVLAYRRGELPRSAATLGVLVAVLMVAQIGLGYSGRGGGWPAAVHIPNGVLVTALLAALLAITLSPRAESLRR
jgi:heme A synthase